MDVFKLTESAIGVTKRVHEIATDLKSLEMIEEIVNLRSMLVDIKHANIDLTEQIKKLESEISDKNAMVFDGASGLFYKQLDNGEKEGSYCPTCYQKDNNPVRLRYENTKHFTGHFCDVCNNSWGKHHPLETFVSNDYDPLA